MAPILCDTPEPLIRRADNASAKGALGSRGRQVTSPQYIYIPSAAESCPKNLAPRWMRAWKVRPSLGSLEKKKIYQQGVHGIFQTKAINFPPCKDGGGAHTLTHPLHVSLCAADHQVFSLQGVRNGEMLAYKLQADRYKCKSNLLSSSSFGVSRLETIAPPHATRHRRQHYAGSKRATSRPTCLSIIVPVALLKLGECLLVQCDMIQAHKAWRVGATRTL